MNQRIDQGKVTGTIDIYESMTEEQLRAFKARMYRKHLAEVEAIGDQGLCCCGDSINGHLDPYTCGHTPVNMYEYTRNAILEELDRLGPIETEGERIMRITRGMF